MGIVTNDQGNMSGQSLGTVIGAVVGAVVAAALSWGTLTYAGLALGAETGALPPLPPLYPCAPGMPAALINSVLGLPFRLGSRDPTSGSLDCFGLVQYLLTAGRGLQFPAFAPGEPVSLPLTQVWTQTGRKPRTGAARCAPGMWWCGRIPARPRRSAGT